MLKDVPDDPACRVGVVSSRSTRSCLPGRTTELLNHRPLLAAGTPIEVAPGVPRGEDVGSAHQAWRTGPAVDVDLTAMPILTRRSSHHHRVMLRTDCIDSTMPHPVVHQLDEI